MGNLWQVSSCKGSSAPEYGFWSWRGTCARHFYLNCSRVLGMKRKAVAHVCCIMHVKEPVQIKRSLHSVSCMVCHILPQLLVLTLTGHHILSFIIKNNIYTTVIGLMSA